MESERKQGKCSVSKECGKFPSETVCTRRHNTADKGGEAMGCGKKGCKPKEKEKKSTGCGKKK